MKLFGEYLTAAYDYQKENNRVVFLGDRSPLSEKFKAQMEEIETKTAHKDVYKRQQKANAKSNTT